MHVIGFDRRQGYSSSHRVLAISLVGVVVCQSCCVSSIHLLCSVFVKWFPWLVILRGERVCVRVRVCVCVCVLRVYVCVRACVSCCWLNLRLVLLLLFWWWCFSIAQGGGGLEWAGLLRDRMEKVHLPELRFRIRKEINTSMEHKDQDFAQRV